MISQIAVLFIIFLLVLMTSVIFVMRKPKQMENFTTPVAVNVPAANNEDGKLFYVGNKKPEVPDVPIVSDKGEYEFRKPQWLYDGVWGERCRLDGRGYERCDWREQDANFPLDKTGYVYGTDTFFHLPEKRIPIGGQVKRGPECPASSKMYDNGLTYEQNMIENGPVYMARPDVEDVLGFVPKDNNNFLKLPLPKVASF